MLFSLIHGVWTEAGSIDQSPKLGSDSLRINQCMRFWRNIPVDIRKFTNWIETPFSEILTIIRYEF
jgi:hypothetical protein